MTSWNFYRLVTEVLENRVKCLQWCVQNGLLPARKVCSEGHEMVLHEQYSTIGYFRCRKGKKDEMTSRGKGTFFENCRMPPEKILLLVYCFAMDLSSSLTRRESSLDGEETSQETVVDWFGHCKDIIADHLLEQTYDDSKIGGPRKIVDFDVFRLIKRKRSFLKTKGTCVLSVIERDSEEYRVEICPENEDLKTAIISFIKKYVAQGSEIVTEKWSSCSSLNNDGYIVPETLKPSKVLKQASVYSHLEYLYKTKLKKNKEDAFEAIIKLIRLHYAP